MINWSDHKIKFTSGIGCLCMTGLLAATFGKTFPFWLVIGVSILPVLIFIFSKPDELRPSLARILQLIASFWYFATASNVAILFLLYGKRETGWPLLIVGLAVGAIPCAIVFWREIVPEQ